MSIELTGLCREHSFESATALCRRCGLEFCDTCVVYPFGPKKPICKECAMTAGGVRSHVARPAMPPRMVKKRMKAFARNLTTSASAPMPEPEVPDVIDPTDPSRVAEPVAAGSADLPPPPPAAPQQFGAWIEDGTPDDREGDSGGSSIDWNNPFG